MLELRLPHEDLVPSYLGFIAEMRALGETIWEGYLPLEDESASGFVARLREGETRPLPGRVAQTIYWAFRNGEVVGRIALRHGLNDALREFGGHIGYEVRPSLRGKGIAKEMLRKLLLTPKAREIGRLLLTCAPDNVASNRVIRANGGTLERTAFASKPGRDTSYYWIEAASAPIRPHSSESS